MNDLRRSRLALGSCCGSSDAKREYGTESKALSSDELPRDSRRRAIAERRQGSWFAPPWARCPHGVQKSGASKTRPPATFVRKEECDVRNDLSFPGRPAD